MHNSLNTPWGTPTRSPAYRNASRSELFHQSGLAPPGSGTVAGSRCTRHSDWCMHRRSGTQPGSSTASQSPFLRNHLSCHPATAHSSTVRRPVIRPSPWKIDVGDASARHRSVGSPLSCHCRSHMRMIAECRLATTDRNLAGNPQSRMSNLHFAIRRLLSSRHLFRVTLGGRGAKRLARRRSAAPLPWERPRTRAGPSLRRPGLGRVQWPSLF